MTINFLTLTNLGADFDLGTRVLNKVNIVSATSPQIIGGTDNSSFIKPDAFATAASGGLNFALNARTLGAGTSSSAALLNIGAGTSTQAPIVMASGVLLTTPHAGAFEYDGMKVYFTPSTETRHALAFLDSPVFTGTPTATTAAPGTNTSQLATTAFVATAVATVGGAYLPLVGGTLTGTLNINSANPLLFLNKTSTSASSRIVGATNGVTRWLLELGNATAESADTGSNFVIARYNDAGTLVDIPLTISRGTGIISLPNILVFPTAAGNDSSNQGATTAFVANNFIARTGGSMTGNLSIVNANPTLNLNKAASGGVNQLIGYTNSSPRWDIQLGNGNGETGSNVGSDLGIYRYDDSGVFIDGPMSINRSSGIVYFNHIPVIPTATTGDNSTQVATTAFVATAVATGGGAYLPLSGGTLTGTLAISSANGILTLNKSASGASTSIFGKTGNLSRWWMELGNADAETGSNVGSNFYISRYNDAGVYVDSPVYIARNNGYVYLATAFTPTATVGDNSTRIATTSFVATSFAPLAYPVLTGLTQTEYLKVGGGNANLGNASYATINSVFGTLANSVYSGFGWNYSNGGAELDLFINGGGLQIYNFPNVSGPITKIFQVDNAGNTYNPGIITAGGRISSGGPGTGGIFVDGSSSQQFFGSKNTTQLGIYNGGTWIITADANSAFLANTPSAGDNSTKIASTAFVTTALTSYLPLSGGLLTGQLQISGGAYSNLLLNKTGNTGANQVGGYVNNVVRWILQLGGTTAETGSNAGSDFGIYRYDDAGVYIDEPMVISRQSGIIYFNKIPVAPTATTGDNSAQVATTAFVATAVATGGGAYLPLGGGTLTGNLNINTANPTIVLNKSSGASGNNQILGNTANAARWLLRLGNEAVESGSNVGSDFAIYNYNDAGVLIGNPLSINRSSGIVYFGSTPAFPTIATSDNSTSGATTAFVKSVASAYLPLTGGTLSGNLNIGGAYPTINLSKSSGASQIFGELNGVPRWLMRFGDESVEGGSNTGSNFLIYRYADDGSYLDSPLQINRATGEVSFSHSPTFPTAADGDNTARGANTNFVVRYAAPITNPTLLGLTTTQVFKVGGGNANFGGASYATINANFGTLANSGCMGIGWNYFGGGGGGETAMFISRNGGNLGGLKIFDFPATSGPITNIFSVDGTGNVYSPGTMIVGARINSGGPGTGGIWVDGGTNQFFGSETSTIMGMFNNGAWIVTVDSTGHAYAPTVAVGTNDNQIATTAFVALSVATGGGAYLPLSGGTLTGNLNISTANSTLNLNKSASGGTNQLIGYTNNSPRWNVQLGNGGGETGSDAGSDFAIYSYNDAGASNRNPFSINRATGAISTTSLYATGFLQVNNPSDNDHTLFVVGATRGIRFGTNSVYASIEGVQNTIGSYQPLWVGGSQLLFSVSGVEKARFDTSGNFCLGTTSGSHKLEVVGDGNFNGNLTSQYLGVATGSPYVVLNKTTGASGQNAILGQTAGISRWQIRLGDGNPEGTGNAGSDFYIDSFADSGAYLTSPIVIARSSGNINLNGAVFATTLTAGTNNTQLATTAFVQTATAAYLPLTGGGMTGNLYLNYGYPSIILNKSSGGAQANQILGQTANNARWLLELGNPALETGTGNTGSDFGLHRYGDAGNYLGTSLSINRASGSIYFSTAPVFPTLAAGTNNTQAATTEFVTTATSGYFPVTGGTINGDISLSYHAYPTISLNKNATGASQIFGLLNGKGRWLMRLGDESPEGGSTNAGSNFLLYRYNDDGSYIDSPLQITRSTGIVSFIYTPTFPSPSVGDNSTRGATTNFVQAAINGYLPLTGGIITGNLYVSTGMLQTPYLKVGGGNANLGGASYATINSVFTTLANSGCVGFGWNYGSGTGETDMFISRNGGSTGGLRMYDFPATSGAITNIWTVDGAGNTSNPGAYTVGGRITSGAPATGGLWVDGGSAQFFGSLSSTQMGLYNNGHWAVVVDNTGAATAPTVSYGANDTQIATTAYVYNAFAKRIVFDSDFGCVGDNSTDDTTAITNFINHAIANPGVEHRFRSLTYKITNVLPDINVSGVIIRGAGSDIHNSDGSHISGTVLNYSSGGAIEHVLRITSVDSTSSLVLTNVQFTGIGINCNSLCNVGLYMLSVTDSVVDVTIINAIYVGLYMSVVANLLANEARDNQRNKITLSSRQLESASGSALWCDGDEVANTSLNEFWVNALHATGTAIELKNSDNNIWRQIRTYATGALGSTYSVRCYGNASASSYRYSRNELFEFTSSNRPIQVDGTASFPSGRASTDHVLQHIDFGNEWYYPAVQPLGTIRLPYQAISVKGDANDVLIEAINTYSIGLSVQGTVRWKVDGAGGHFIPTADYAYNIGGTSNRVAELYAVNTHFTTVTTGSVTAASSINTDYLYSLNSFTAFSRSTTATSGNQYTQLYAADGVNVAIYLGASGGAYTDPTTYYRNTNHVIGSVGGAAVYLAISSTAATFNIPVYAPTAAVGTNNTQVATTGFVHNALTGSPATPVQTFTLEQFGGAGDGTTSNDSAWSSALTSIGSGSGAVILGCGTYVFSAGVAASITSGKSLTVKGQGADVSIILFSSNSGMTLNYGDQYSSSHVRDLSFKCGTTGGFGLKLYQASSDTNPANTALRDVTGVTFTGSDGYSASNYFGYSLFIDNVSNVNVISCSFNMPAGQGIGMQIQGRGTASTYGVVYNLLNCVFFGGNINFVYGEWVQGVTIAQTNFTGSNVGIYAAASTAGSLQGLAVSSCQFACINENILLSTQVSNVCLSNNLFLNANPSATATIFVYGILVNFNIVGNQFNASPQGSTEGIIVTGGGNGTITGNVFGGLYKAFDLTAGTSNIIVQSNSYVNVGIGGTPVLYTNSGMNNFIGGGHA
jgi:hypothetical protein